MSGKVTSVMDKMDMDEYSGDQDNEHTRHLHEWIRGWAFCEEDFQKI